MSFRRRTEEFCRGTKLAALKLWAKAKLHEVEDVSLERQGWQAAVAMAIEAAYNVGRMDKAT
jgi:hypothetical protein